MGGQKGIALFYKFLSKRLSLKALTIQKNNTPQDYEITNTISNTPWRYINPFLFFTLKKLIKQKTITHLLFEHPYYAWLIFLFKKFTSIQIIVHSHNIESERFKSIGKWWWKILWYYEKWAYTSAHQVWFKTENDMQYAVVEYGITLKTASVIPYGVELDTLPAESELLAAKAILQKQYGIPKDEVIILFNGTLNYRPNLDALISILDGINPLLLAKDLSYKILICGKNLPADMNNLQAYQSKNIIYCGFVEDIDLYFKGCDIFLNPLQDGGGIKTKLVEALGFGKKCISSDNGAIGVSEYAAQGRLVIVADRNWKAYADAICGELTQISNDNSLFYQTYSWKNIALKALSTITE